MRKHYTNSATSPTVLTVEEAYRWCLQLAQHHYENFPVASRLLPARLRRPVAVIYAFARIADDFADEGGSAAERLARLDDWEQQLEACDSNIPSSHPVFVALAPVLRQHGLALQSFRDLLSAFRQDVVKTRYRDFNELLDYCRRSANPVGRLLLQLNGDATEENLLLSDRICTSLQLINFWQDLAQDIAENDRLYLPADELAQFGVHETTLRSSLADDRLRALMAFQYERTRTLMVQGAPLVRKVRGRLGWELRFIVAGGLRILQRLAEQQDPFARPRLTRKDLGRTLLGALRLPAWGPWRFGGTP